MSGNGFDINKYSLQDRKTDTLKIPRQSEARKRSGFGVFKRKSTVDGQPTLASKVRKSVAGRISNATQNTRALILSAKARSQVIARERQKEAESRKPKVSTEPPPPPRERVERFSENVKAMNQAKIDKYNADIAAAKQAVENSPTDAKKEQAEFNLNKTKKEYKQSGYETTEAFLLSTKEQSKQELAEMAFRTAPNIWDDAPSSVLRSLCDRHGMNMLSFTSHLPKMAMYYTGKAGASTTWKSSDVLLQSMMATAELSNLKNSKLAKRIQALDKKTKENSPDLLKVINPDTHKLMTDDDIVKAIKQQEQIIEDLALDDQLSKNRNVDEYHKQFEILMDLKELQALHGQLNSELGNSMKNTKFLTEISVAEKVLSTLKENLSHLEIRYENKKNKPPTYWLDRNKIEIEIEEAESRINDLHKNLLETLPKPDAPGFDDIKATSSPASDDPILVQIGKLYSYKRELIEQETSRFEAEYLNSNYVKNIEELNEQQKIEMQKYITNKLAEPAPEIIALNESILGIQLQYAKSKQNAHKLINEKHQQIPKIEGTINNRARAGAYTEPAPAARSRRGAVTKTHEQRVQELQADLKNLKGKRDARHSQLVKLTKQKTPKTPTKQENRQIAIDTFIKVLKSYDDKIEKLEKQVQNIEQFIKNTDSQTNNKRKAEGPTSGEPAPKRQRSDSVTSVESSDGDLQASPTAALVGAGHFKSSQTADTTNKTFGTTSPQQLPSIQEEKDQPEVSQTRSTRP